MNNDSLIEKDTIEENIEKDKNKKLNEFKNSPDFQEIRNLFPDAKIIEMHLD